MADWILPISMLKMVKCKLKSPKKRDGMDKKLDVQMINNWGDWENQAARYDSFITPWYFGTLVILMLCIFFNYGYWT